MNSTRLRFINARSVSRHVPERLHMYNSGRQLRDGTYCWAATMAVFTLLCKSTPPLKPGFVLRLSYNHGGTFPALPPLMCVEPKFIEYPQVIVL